MNLSRTVTQYARRRGYFVVFVCVLLILAYYVISSRYSDLYFTNEEQASVLYIGKYLKVNIEIIDNRIGSSLIILTNTGRKKVKSGKWRIYLNTLSRFNIKNNAGLDVHWVNGGLFYLAPVNGEFKGIDTGKSLTLHVEGMNAAARTDVFPRWYAWSPVGTTKPAVIEYTDDESLSFVAAYNESKKWKRNENDLYNPYTPEERFILNSLPTTDRTGKLNVIPTLKTVLHSKKGNFVIDRSWVVVKSTDSDDVEPRSKVFANILGFSETTDVPSEGKYFEFVTKPELGDEEYTIEFKKDKNIVTVTSKGARGAFYAIQTLLMIIGDTKTLKTGSFPDMFIYDKPRFGFRGLMIDVARNFHPKDTILKLIDGMSMYKLNKLHMHLSDDEGWRLEIPGLPELTKYGSKRCYDSKKCLNPALGSGPFETTSGSGYYSVSDFREILRYAEKRFVQIIPEIDMPGHSYSALFSMSHRDQDHVYDQSSGKYESLKLSEVTSNAASVQGWTGNAINPCINTSYVFVDKIITALEDIYNGVQKLDIVHFGGDEVADDVWAQSQSCLRLFQGSKVDQYALKKMFFFTVGDIAHKHGLKIALWEDGAYDWDSVIPFEIDKFKQKDVYIQTWNNIWETGRGSMASEFSDAGYNVILSMATHLYFDHPYEPDPEERGLYWATRYIDTYRSFGLLPMDIFANADVMSSGHPINWKRACPTGKCPRINKPEKVVGMEACVWSETIRTKDHLFSMIFPRLLALAERAWHEGSWEDIKDAKKREPMKKADWANFVHALGETHLPLLDRKGIHYRLEPPGIQVNEDKKVIEFNTLYPNHKILVSFGNNRWHVVKTDVPIPDRHVAIYAKTISPVLERESRTVSIVVGVSGSNWHLVSPNVIIFCLFSVLTAAWI